MLRIHCKSVISIHRVNKPKRMWWSFPNLKIRPGKIYKLLHECGERTSSQRLRNEFNGTILKSNEFKS